MKRADFTDKYNTKLGPLEEQAFQRWVKSIGKEKDLFDYDLRGFWKDKAQFAADGHGSDKYKKPNHPTFSTESKYSGVDGYEGGRWSGDDKRGWSYEASDTNRKFHGDDGLKDFFKRNEQGIQLTFPAEMRERDIGIRGQMREGVAAVAKKMGYSNYRANEVAQAILGRLSDEVPTQRATGPGAVRDMVTGVGLADVAHAPTSLALTAVDIGDAIQQGRTRDATVITALAAAPYALPRAGRAMKAANKYMTEKVSDNVKSPAKTNVESLGPVVRYEPIPQDEAPNFYTASQREMVSFMKPGQKYNPSDILKRLQGKVSKQELGETGLSDWLQYKSRLGEKITVEDFHEATKNAASANPFTFGADRSGPFMGNGPQFPSDRSNMRVMTASDPYGSNEGSVYYINDSTNAKTIKVQDVREDAKDRLESGYNRAHVGVSDPNTIMWVRTADIETPDGGIAKVVNEVQSDRHARGTSVGYSDENLRKLIDSDIANSDNINYMSLMNGREVDGLGGTFFRGTNRYGALGGQIALQDAMRSGSGVLLVPGRETFINRGVPEKHFDTLYGDKGVVTSEVRKHVKAAGGTEDTVEMTGKVRDNSFPPSRWDQIKNAVDIVRGAVAPDFVLNTRYIGGRNPENDVMMRSAWDNRSDRAIGPDDSFMDRMRRAKRSIGEAADLFKMQREFNAGTANLADAMQDAQNLHSKATDSETLHPLLDKFAKKNNMRFTYFDDTAFKYVKEPDGSLRPLTTDERYQIWNERLENLHNERAKTTPNYSREQSMEPDVESLRQLVDSLKYGDGSHNSLDLSYEYGQKLFPNGGPMSGMAVSDISNMLRSDANNRITSMQMVHKPTAETTDTFRRFTFDPHQMRDYLNKNGGWRLPAAAGLSAEGMNNMNLRYELPEEDR